MDRLKEALGRLHAPDCPNCHVTMRWFRSELLRDSPESVIAHLFVCPNCERAERSDTKFRPVRVPPSKLAAPRLLAL